MVLPRLVTEDIYIEIAPLTYIARCYAAAEAKKRYFVAVIKKHPEGRSGSSFSL